MDSLYCKKATDGSTSHIIHDLPGHLESSIHSSYVLHLGNSHPRLKPGQARQSGITRCGDLDANSRRERRVGGVYP